MKKSLRKKNHLHGLHGMVNRWFAGNQLAAGLSG